MWGFSKRTSPISLSLLFQRYPACLVRLTWMVLGIEGKWPYSCYFVECCFPDLFNTARSILVKFPSSFFSMRFLTDHMVHPHSNIYTTATWKKFILSNRSKFHIIESLSIAVYAFAWLILTSLSVHETLLLSYVNLSTDFRGPPFKVEMVSSRLKHFTPFCLRSRKGQSPPPAAYSTLYNRESAWVDVFARSTMSSA